MFTYSHYALIIAVQANGMCDNLLTCVVRAWDIANPLLFCPAMNTHMYQHPLTARHIASLKVGPTVDSCLEHILPSMNIFITAIL